MPSASHPVPADVLSAAQAAIAAAFICSPDELASRNRRRWAVERRWTLYFLLRGRGYTSGAIGRATHWSPATIRHGLRRLADLFDVDPTLAGAVNLARRRFTEVGRGSRRAGDESKPTFGPLCGAAQSEAA
jgi:hypothetical protein